MNYRQAQRLAVVQDDSDNSKLLARKAIDLIDEAPKLVSLQTVEPGGPSINVIAKAAIASKPNYVLWTGAAEAGGQLAKALRANGYKGNFAATAQSESPAFLAAAGPQGVNGAFVTATASPANTPTAAPWKAAFERTYHRAPGFDAMQAYDSVRILAHAMQKARTTDNHAAVVKQISQLDMQMTNSMGVVRFAGDHTLLYDNRVILEGKNGKFAWKRSLRTDSL
jgi:branched-chain amino acid transport system substrate-binding protein